MRHDDFVFTLIVNDFPEVDGTDTATFFVELVADIEQQTGEQGKSVCTIGSGERRGSKPIGKHERQRS